MLEREQAGLAWGEWSRFVSQLEARNDPDDRGWLLLGRQKLDELEGAAKTRRDAAERLLERAAELATAGELEAALGLIQQVERDYREAAVGDAALSEVLREALKTIQTLRSVGEGQPPASAPAAREGSPGDRPAQPPGAGGP
jgi:hypothetical protein